MALKTSVNIKYRTPYLPRVDLPADQEKIMKHEISLFRKNLIRKQEALERSTKYEHNERLLNQLKEIRVADLKTSQDVWKTWNRLNLLEQSHNTSITGKRETERLQIESLKEAGFDFITKDNFKQFYEFMNYAKDNTPKKIYDSDTIAKWYTQHRKQGVQKIYGKFNEWKNKGFES